MPLFCKMQRTRGRKLGTIQYIMYSGSPCCTCYSSIEYELYCLSSFPLIIVNCIVMAWLPFCLMSQYSHLYLRKLCRIGDHVFPKYIISIRIRTDTFESIYHYWCIKEMQKFFNNNSPLNSVWQVVLQYLLILNF